MSYFLGIDLGTTYTAAAIWRDGRAEVIGLGSRAPVIPSVVLLREDGEVLTGEAAARRAVIEPQRIAREFKRRIGDPTPIIVGGAPYSADALTARLLRSVVDLVVEDQHGRPAGIGISHPANWGSYKKDLLRQAIELADLGEVVLLSEPEAAAIHYASQARVETGSVIAVYDLGGGTFDAAVLRRTESGWEILGQPEGVERLGGVDFDQAVFQHVINVIGAPYDCLDPDDPATLSAVTRLRQECVEAKEALAADTDVTIPVLLPTVHTEVRLTRVEFEDMIRPALGDSIAGLHRALRSAGLAAGEISAVLLVGGSSRIPLVAQLVGSAFVRPVAVDAHPKHGVALGAAILAADHASPGAVNTSEVEPLEDDTSAAVFWTAPTSASTRPAETTVFQIHTPPETGPVAAALPLRPGPGRGSRPRPRHSTKTDASERDQRRGRALGLVFSGVVALAVALVGVLALGRGEGSGQSPSNPAGVPANITPDGGLSEDHPSRSSTTSGHTTSTSPEAETTTTADDNRPTTTSSTRPTTTTTEATTTTESTTTTEATTTTTAPPDTTTTSVPVESLISPDGAASSP